MKTLYILIMMFSLAGCGTTQLVTYSSDVDIYVNNQLKGKGQATVVRTGPPQKIHVEAKYHGQKIGEIDIRRKVKLISCLVGAYTYGIGLLFTLQYPETVIIPTKDFLKNRSFEKTENVWDLPPGEWKKQP